MNNTFIEITREAFQALVGDTQPLIEMSAGSNVERFSYDAKGLHIRAITNHYSRPITQYYVRDINA